MEIYTQDLETVHGLSGRWTWSLTPHYTPLLDTILSHFNPCRILHPIPLRSIFISHIFSAYKFTAFREISLQKFCTCFFIILHASCTMWRLDLTTQTVSWVVSTSASHSGVSGFEYRPGYRYPEWLFSWFSPVFSGKCWKSILKYPTNPFSNSLSTWP
jgi:hypothetical protein